MSELRAQQQQLAWRRLRATCHSRRIATSAAAAAATITSRWQWRQLPQLRLGAIMAEHEARDTSKAECPLLRKGQQLERRRSLKIFEREQAQLCVDATGDEKRMR